jgi:hypothetical protein
MSTNAATIQDPPPSARQRSVPPPIETMLPPERREALRAKLVAETPRWYVPAVHMLVPSLCGIVMIGVALSLIDNLSAWQLLTVPIVYVFANANEWTIHRIALHQRHPLAPVLYDQHTPKHHMLYVTDDMAIRDPREYRLVLIPAYGLFLIFATTLPITATIWWLGYRNVACLYAATGIAYAVSYEWLHLSYHLPKGHPVGRSRLIRILRRHHAIHHDPRLMQRWNLNVTVPLWDKVMRTIVTEYPPRE